MPDLLDQPASRIRIRGPALKRLDILPPSPFSFALMAPLPSETVLEETPGRALTSLRGIAKYPHIQAILVQNGYTPDRHAEGWKLLLAAAGAPSATPSPTPASTPAAKAIVALDAWDEKGFARIDAALE